MTKVFKRAVKIVSKSHSKPLTYAAIRKKLEKVGKPNAADLDKCLQQFESEIESGSLVSALRAGTTKATTAKTTTTATTAAASKPDDEKTTAAATAVGEASTPDDSTEPGVLRRFPSLTWRQANERARILFYKGRTPSIHYNEKRDSFRVSMLAEVIKDGQHKMAEVPVTDDDVRRLLNSFGLYWDGESISLLAKSDEIFTSAQQEAFDFILSGAAGNTSNSGGSGDNSQPAAQAPAAPTTTNNDANNEATTATSESSEKPASSSGDQSEAKEAAADDQNTVKLTLIA